MEALDFVHSSHQLGRLHGLNLSSRLEALVNAEISSQPRSLRFAKRDHTRAIKSCPTSPTRDSGNRRTERPLLRELLPSRRTSTESLIQFRQQYKRTNADHQLRKRRGQFASQNELSKDTPYAFSVAIEPNQFASLLMKRPPLDIGQSIPSKRSRPLHDVDGPGTGCLPSKKRRLRRDLITSRLSQPFSLPATHVLNRESDDDTPCISRFLKAAAIGARKAGHESSLVRKAAILNSIRLRAHHAAVTKGHAEMAGLAARQTFLSHGQQVVTARTTISPGTRYPVSEGEPGKRRLPAGWRPHTTIPPRSNTMLAQAPLQLPAPRFRLNVTAYATSTGQSLSTLSQAPALPGRSPSPIASMETANPHRKRWSEEEEQEGEDSDESGMAFPAAELDSRYADLSDDDMDEVYADFSAIFGPRSTSAEPEPGNAGSPRSENEEHFYEEYLDELDGIPWMS